MYPNNFKFKTNRHGAIMGFVLIVFLVITIIASSIIFIFSSNLKMAKIQEENMRAHYLANSGIEMALSTLLNTLYVEDGKEKTIIDKMKKDNTTVQLKDEIDIEGKKIEIIVDYIKDSNEIIIKSSTEIDSGGTKDLLLRLEFSGNKFKTRWN